MPELPEVEAARVFVERHCLGRTISKAVVADDDKVIEGIGHTQLEAALKGRKLLKSQRKGKHMWLEFDSGPALMLHFGMTGSISVRGQKSVKYVMAKEGDPDLWPPRFWKVQLDFSGDVQMAFCDSRRFARVRLQEDPANSEPVASLGFDVLAGVPPLEELARKLATKRGAIKTILLDQAFSAGVGNWVADEICHSARIHPEQRGMDLTQPQLEALRRALVEVPRTAVDVDADSSKFPKDWIFHHRWEEKKSPAGISFLKIGGRTTAIEPALQKLAPVTKAAPVSKPAAGKARGAAKRGKPPAAADADAGDVKAESGAAKKRRKNRPVKGEAAGTPKEGKDSQEPRGKKRKADAEEGKRPASKPAKQPVKQPAPEAAKPAAGRKKGRKS